MKLLTIAACVFTLMSHNVAVAEDQVLLRGELVADGENTQAFSLSGEDRQQVIGGEIRLNNHVYSIEKVSVHSLIGAKKITDDTQQFVVFSSSYSDQTATGEPWVKAETAHQCDEPYNSFLALYSVTSKDKLEGLAEVPYAELVESLQYSDSSVLYCFLAKPPE